MFYVFSVSGYTELWYLYHIEFCVCWHRTYT